MASSLLNVSASDSIKVNPNVTVGLCNPKSPTNVGAVMRAAGCYGVGAVQYTGVRYLRAAEFQGKLQTDTKKAKLRIPLTCVDTFLDGKPGDVQVVCVELAEGAIPLPEFTHPEKALYVFGPEDGSIDQALVNRADAVVYIPTIGCMNLAATVNVVLYDRLAKSSESIDHIARVKASRDVNNRLVARHLEPGDKGS